MRTTAFAAFPSLTTEIVWESIEHRRGLATNRVAIHEALSKASTKVEFMDDVTFSADLSDALASPVTEFLSWDLHATTDPEDFHKHRVALTEKFLAASPPGFHTGGWGVTAESDRKLWFCVGWESPEVCGNYYCTVDQSYLFICRHSRPL